MAPILTILLIIIAVTYLYRHRSDLFDSLAGFSLGQIVGLSILRLLAFGLFVKASLSLMQPCAPRLHFRELFVLSTAGLIASYVAPAAGGLAAKGLYLRRRHEIGYLRFGGFQLVLLVACVATASFVGLFGLLALWSTEGQSASMVWWAAIAGLSAGMAPFLAGPALRHHCTTSGPSRFVRYVRAWNEIVPDWRQGSAMILWLMLRALVAFVTMGWLFTLLTERLHAFWIGGVVESLTIIFQIVRITPGNVGIYEWVVSLLGGQLGIGLAYGLLAAAVYRLLGILVTVTASALLIVGRQLLQHEQEAWPWG